MLNFVERIFPMPKRTGSCYLRRKKGKGTRVTIITCIISLTWLLFPSEIMSLM